MMTTSPTASSASSTSVADLTSSVATTTASATIATMTNTDHPYANNAGRTDPEELLADDLHRRASTISDAVTTASSAEICRRFSNGSTSSTAASSMVTLPSVEEKPTCVASPAVLSSCTSTSSTGAVAAAAVANTTTTSVVSPLVTPPPPQPQEEEEERKQQQQQQQPVSSAASSSPSPDPVHDAMMDDDVETATPLPTTSSTTSEQTMPRVSAENEGENDKEVVKDKDLSIKVNQDDDDAVTVEEDDDDDELPIWADPDRVRENPTRYAYVKTYMDKHTIPKTSAMPLPNVCTFYFSETNASKGQKTANYMSTVRPLFDCQTVWDFSSRWRHYKMLQRRRPSQMANNQNLYCFVKGVAPMWEDSVNREGGRLTTLCPNRADLDDLFDWVLASFVGGKLTKDGMVGLVLSKRSRGDRIELWLDGSASVDTMPALKAQLCQYLPEHLCALVNASRYKKHFDK
ncbi:translation initiation factor eIF 4e-like domain-containing protein [Zychaea mexicana]|uniref:translation initiation factor eIF 4e-like domain-containing protein n=1 Tax=Zychaea mexicana TaxID=64656 RepID=UPI0022FE9200|nr:translation initiation factor eIF 4e-like domain-containing protein [Zychaea mexicana]KAI9492272.1 translation initiation factor eIF 4e-like domain-containing protein [Zychaea mexicana]